MNKNIKNTNKSLPESREDVLYNRRAEYGKQVVKNLAKKLIEKYGNGWSDRKLTHCIRTAYTFSKDEIRLLFV